MLNAAVIGLGWWGKHIIRRTKGSRDIRLVMAVDQNAKLAAFAREHGVPFAASFQAALDSKDVEAVLLATPHSLHTEQIAAAAKAGKHVFCEKPLALSAKDAAASVAACKSAGVFLGIGHERRYEPAMTELRKLVKRGALGTIMHAEACFNHDKLANVPKGDWRTSPKDAPAAGMTAMGIHLSDAFIDLFGPVDEVYAMTAARVAYKDNGDVVSALLRHKSGPTSYINAILVTQHRIGYLVYGSEGWADVVYSTHPDTPGSSRLSVEWRDGGRWSQDYQWEDTVRLNLEAFARAAEGRGEYMFTDAQKIANIATLEAIARSVAENRPVKVEAAESLGNASSAPSGASSPRRAPASQKARSKPKS
ncbi:MAG: Gfo/Idh/MocA family protein [Hyphomicrobiaceae bacterium]